MKLSFFKTLLPKEKSQMLIAVVLLVVLSPFQNCGRRFIEKQSEDLNISSTVGGNGLKLYSENCSICHGSMGNSTIVNKTEEGIKFALKNQLQMRFIVLSDSEISQIVLALNHKDELTPPPPSPLDEKPGYQIQVKNRFSLASNFLELFFNDISPNADDNAIKAIIKLYITDHSEAFGGNCQRNDEGCTPDICGLTSYPSDPIDCRNKLAISSMAELNPQLSSISMGYVQKTCEEVLKYNRAVENVLSKSGMSLATPISVDSVSTLSSFIFEGRAISSAAIDQSLSLANEASLMGLNQTEQWRFITLSFCLSSIVHLL